MARDGADKLSRSEVGEGSETTIEIKIKTLDSQTYTLRVDKQMPVPALKEQIASVTGVLSEQQRLICRGKVLKDDQLLSAYHVEDGHTLHLVVRQPIPPSAEGLNHPDPAFSTGRDPGSHPSVVIETFSLPDQGDSVPPEISRIVSAVLGSFGFSNIGSAGEGVDVNRERGFLRTSASSATADATQQQPEQATSRGQSDGLQSAFGLPTAVSLGSMHPPVFPDSLATLSQYLANMRREFDAIGRGGENINQADATLRSDQRDSNPISQPASAQERLPTPASLAEVIRSSRQLLIDQAAESLLRLAIQLEDQANLTDPALRSDTQSSAWRTGVQLHNLGAFLLELGRTTMTLRLGQAPSEAVVNAGPAVFINPSGPNPLMVQPLPFQPGPSFGGAIPTGSLQPGSGMVNSIGTGFLPRRIDIQIRRGSSASTQNANREERGDAQQVSGQRNSQSGSGSENTGTQTTSRIIEGSSFTGEPGVRVVPLRTMVAAVPGSFGRLPSDSSGNIGLYYPLLGRVQHVASGNINAGQGSQPSAENQHASVHEQQSTSEANPVHHDNSNSRQQERSGNHSINIDVLSSGGIQSNHESERRIPNGVMQFLSNLFPGGEIHLDEASLRGQAADSAPVNVGTSTASADSETRVTDEGLFLSNLLREIMPIISQHGGAESNASPSGEAQDSGHQRAQDSSVHAESSDVGASRRRSDSDLSPNLKRRKTE